MKTRPVIGVTLALAAVAAGWYIVWRQERVQAHLDPLNNLHLVGRNGLHKYNNQDHSMLTSMLVVENMKGAAHDVWAVNTDFDYHEEQRAKTSGARGTARAKARA